MRYRVVSYILVFIGLGICFTPLMTNNEVTQTILASTDMEAHLSVIRGEYEGALPYLGSKVASFLFLPFIKLQSILKFWHISHKAYSTGC